METLFKNRLRSAILKNEVEIVRNLFLFSPQDKFVAALPFHDLILADSKILFAYHNFITKDDIISTDNHGNTLLHQAVKRRDYTVEIIKILIARAGTKICNMKNSYGMNALSVALFIRNGDSADYLIPFSDLNSKDEYNYTPLQYCSLGQNKIEIYKKLIRSGADPTVVCCDIYTTKRRWSDENKFVILFLNTKIYLLSNFLHSRGVGLAVIKTVVEQMYFDIYKIMKEYDLVCLINLGTTIRGCNREMIEIEISRLKNREKRDFERKRGYERMDKEQGK